MSLKRGLLYGVTARCYSSDIPILLCRYAFFVHVIVSNLVLWQVDHLFFDVILLLYCLQAGLFFLKHAEAVEKDLPARELHEMLLLSLQWLSGMITQSNP